MRVRYAEGLNSVGWGFGRDIARGEFIELGCRLEVGDKGVRGVIIVLYRGFLFGKILSFRIR